ncbi:hypothetical protein EON64_20460 [archaeon]|nr:MAG: hypothetical protein EON64_20460 [archaeon]
MFSDASLGLVVKDLLQLSWYSTWSTDQRCSLPREVQERLQYLSPFIQIQRPAIDEEATGYLKLLGVECECCGNSLYVPYFLSCCTCCSA